MLRFFFNNLKWFFAGSFVMVLAACYGAPVDMRNSITVKGTDSNGEAIQGLKMTLFNKQTKISEDYTDSTGEVYYPELKIDEFNKYTISVEDVDGEENGGPFAAQNIEIIESQSVYSVKMQ